MTNTPGGTDTVTESATDIIGSVFTRGIHSDYAVLVVLPVVITVLWLGVWRYGGGKQLIAALVSVVETIKDSLQCAKEIAEIHERVILKSPVEHAEVLRAKHAPPADRSPSPRLRKEAAEA